MIRNTRARAILGLGLTFLAITVGFQNCGQFASQSKSITSSSTSGRRGNMVSEAGLSGQNVVKSSDINLAAINPGEQSRMVTCAADGTTCVARDMPLLNQNEMPTPYADMYCVPTSATMLFETFQRAGFTFPRNEGPEFSALSDSAQRALWLGNKMMTDKNGTYANLEVNVLDSLMWSAMPAYELKSVAAADVTPSTMKTDARNNTIALMSYGHYSATNPRTLISGRRAVDMVRNGGHSITINGFRTAGDQIETIYNDPWDKLQYARAFVSVPIDGGVQYNFPYLPADGRRSTFAVFTFGSGENMGVELIDGYYPMVPSSPSRPIPGVVAVDPAVTNAQAVIQGAYQKILNRAADPAGLAGLTPTVLGGATQAQVEDILMASDEYKSAHPTAAVPAPITAVAPTPPTVSQRPATTQHPTDTLVRVLFQSFLKRAPDQTAYDTFAVYSSAKIGYMIGASPEASSYYVGLNTEDFVRYLYNAMLFRQADQWEVDFWSNELNSGRITRAQAVDGFATSPEFANMAARL